MNYDKEEEFLEILRKNVIDAGLIMNNKKSAVMLLKKY